MRKNNFLERNTNLKKSNEKVREQKAITLIALVITIIVLLILASVSIAMLTGENGIIGKAKTAAEEHTEKAALEKLRLKLTEYTIDQNDNINPVLKEYLEAIDGCSEVREDETEDNIGGYIVVIDDYEFRVSIKGEVLESLGKATSPRILLTQNGKNIEISITERGENVTVLKILDSTDQVIASATKESMTKNEQSYVFNHSFDAEGTYVVKLTTQEGKEYTKEVIIDLTPPADPVITSNYGYAIITENGVKQDGTTKITYETGENIENYYSLDGTNWQKYTGEFQYAQAGTIYAKSVKKSNGTESTANKTISIPSDAIGANAYDDDETSYEQYKYSLYTLEYHKYMLIDESIQNSKLNIKCSFSWNVPTYVYFYNTEGTKVGTKQLYAYCDRDSEIGYQTEFNGIRQVDIPNAAVKMEICVFCNSTTAIANIYDIKKQ